MAINTSDNNGLFVEFKKGDDNAFSFFYKFFINGLYAYGVSLGAEREVVKDAIQDLFLKIYFDEKDFSSIDHLKYFLLKSLKNSLYNTYKSKIVSTATNITEDILNFSITTTVLDQIIDEEDRAIIKSKIDTLLSKLTSRQKEAIYLRFIQELEYSEIADILSMSPHAARKLISRSMKRLREFQTGQIITSQMKKAERFAIFIATAGQEFEDRMIQVKKRNDQLDTYLVDIIGNCIVENTGDIMEKYLKNEIGSAEHTNRFSPGYCNWKLTDQKKIFEILSENPCGVYLSDACFMSPVKSISGIIGIGNDLERRQYACNLCKLENCYKRKYEYEKSSKLA